MKHLLLFFFFTTALFSQKTTEPFKSNTLGETRQITISLPASYEQNPTKKYPLLILLDGEYLFDPFNGALNYGGYWDDLPETIIVGINQNRNNERIADSNFDQTNGYQQKKELHFLNSLEENYSLTLKKNTAQPLLESLLDTTQLLGF